MTSWASNFVSRAQARRDRELADAQRAERADRRARAARDLEAREAADRANPPRLRVEHPLVDVTRAELYAELAGTPRPWSLADVASAEHRVQVRHLRSIGAL